MKKSIRSTVLKIGLLFLMTLSGVYAQNEYELEKEFSTVAEVKSYMEELFSGLEKNRVPYGILLDKYL